MTDQFANVKITREMPAEDFADVVLDTPFTRMPRGLFVGGDGNITAPNLAGVDSTFAVKGGGIYAIRFNQINTVGTTATGLILLY